MAFTGGLSPSPERTGGGAPRLRRIIEALGAQLGSAFDTTSTSNVYAEMQAYGRAINEAWGNGVRLANQWDPLRVTDFMGRWEAILGLTPAPTDLDTVRRARIAASLVRIGRANTFQAVVDAITAAVGSTVFVSITHTSSSGAVVVTPSGWPVGVQLSGVTWYSTTAHVLVLVTQPTGMSDSQFYSQVSAMNPVLDAMLPAWCTWDWARSTTLHSIAITSSTNTSPIVVTAINTAPAGIQHGFVAGQTVTIVGHLVNTAANGTWTIGAGGVGGTTAGSTGTTLSLQGSVGNGVGGATGTVSAPGFYCDGDLTTSGSRVNIDNEALA